MPMKTSAVPNRSRIMGEARLKAVSPSSRRKASTWSWMIARMAARSWSEIGACWAMAGATAGTARKPAISARVVNKRKAMQRLYAHGLCDATAVSEVGLADRAELRGCAGGAGAHDDAAWHAAVGRDAAQAGGAQPADIDAVGEGGEVRALAAEEAVLAADLGIELADQAVDVLDRAAGVALDGAELAMVVVGGAADGIGGAHVVDQVAGDRRLGRHLAGQRVELADAQGHGVELGLRVVPLGHEVGVARGGAGLQALRDGA